MKILVAGGDGFIGRNVARTLISQGHEVYKSSRTKEGDSFVKIDLLDSSQVTERIGDVRPEIIINCAGVVGSGADFNENVYITRNLIEAIAEVGLRLHRLVICGSAGEYGQISQDQWPVKETSSLNATNPYAISKVEEEKAALTLSAQYGIDTIVARVFNPIGADMPAKFLISNILRQIDQVKNGSTDPITVGRLDALRDYVDVADVAEALALLATRDHTYDVYNIGSGVATSTQEVVRCILEKSGLPLDTSVSETSPDPEPSVASMADITRLQEDFSWQPRISLQQTIEGVVTSHDNAANE